MRTETPARRQNHNFGGNIMETKIRVLIADPSEDMRMILSETLSREEDVQVVGTAADGPETLAMVTELEIGEEYPEDPDRPSIILRRVGQEDLWTLAKRAGSTVAAIRQANQLEDEPEDGQMLLIPLG
jgi:CheY-like chemotaxis protein